MNFQNYMTLEKSFSGFRFSEGAISHSKWTAKMELIGKDDERVEESQDDLYRLIYWFDTLNDIEPIVADFTDEKTAMLPALLENYLILLPADPADEMLARALYSKISAMIGNSIYLISLTLEADSSPVSYTYSNLQGKELPENWNNLVGECVHSKPWWLRNDGTTMDFVEDGLSKEEIEIVMSHDPIIHFSQISSTSKEQDEDTTEILDASEWISKSTEED